MQQIQLNKNLFNKIMKNFYLKKLEWVVIAKHSARLQNILLEYIMNKWQY